MYSIYKTQKLFINKIEYISNIKRKNNFVNLNRYRILNQNIFHIYSIFYFLKFYSSFL